MFANNTNQPQPSKSSWTLKQSHFKIKLNCQSFNPKIFQHWPYPWRTETQHRQDMQKMYDDRTAHDLPPLVPGQDVRIFDYQTGKWKPVTITSRCAEPRSYILQLPGGSSKRRNRVQIRAAETSSHKQGHFNDHITSLQKWPTNTNNISYQRSIKQPTCNTRSGREIHRPKRYKTNKQGI